MKSELFPELDKALVNRLLRDGIWLTADEPAAGTTLDIVAALGIVHKTTKEHVRCAYREDPDYGDCPDKNCPGLIQLAEHVTSYTCPECGRPVYRIHEKEQFTEYLVRLNREGIEKYIRRLFLELDLVERISSGRGGAFHVSLSDNRPLLLGLLDETAVPNHNTLYIQISPRIRMDTAGLHVIHLADFLSQSANAIKAQWSHHLDTLLLTAEQQKLLDILTDQFNLEEIQEICFRLSIDHEELAGDVKRAKARELISALARRNRLPELVRLIQQQRPEIRVS
jgi:predicted RNA-binding Zn-ribbon protein involved in translation (DUF1610 family)